jgi:hypothetical protein
MRTAIAVDSTPPPHAHATGRGPPSLAFMLSVWPVFLFEQAREQ